MAGPTPTLAPPGPEDLNSSLKRNIEALTVRRREDAASAGPQARIASAITAFTGSMAFVYIHLTLYTAWVLVNVGVFSSIPKFDPSFVILAMEASVEAIFLSTFVLISQNRTAALADKRADLDLHINLLTEHELTKLASVIAAIAAKLDITVDQPAALDEVQRDVAPEVVLDVLDVS
jgi:uncharacterized membrane protein